jgi:hypothetical protein
MDAMKGAAKDLRVPLVGHDIDTEEEAEADRLVEKYGDWDPDYTIPQVFLEFEDGEVKHVLTGKKEGLAFTKKALEEFLHGEDYARLKREQS